MRTRFKLVFGHEVSNYTRHVCHVYSRKCLICIFSLCDTFQLISCSENNRLKVHPETTSDVYSKPLIFVFFFNVSMHACIFPTESLYQLYPEFPGDSFDNQGWSTVIASRVCLGFQTVRLIANTGSKSVWLKYQTQQYATDGRNTHIIYTQLKMEVKTVTLSVSKWKHCLLWFHK